MKNAMKKIMGLLLVAVLLVSVVPFQALAAEVKGDGNYGYKGFENIDICDTDDKILKNAQWREGDKDPETKTPRDILNNFFAGWEAKYTFVSAAYNNQTPGLDDTLHTNFEHTKVRITLKAIPEVTTYTVAVNYYLDGDGAYLTTASFNRKIGETLSFSDVVNAQEAPKGYTVVRFTSSDSNTDFTNSPATITASAEFKAFVVANSNSQDPSTPATTPEQVLTVHYYIDGNYQETKEHKVEHKYISELVEMGKYDASKYAKITANVDGADKGTENVLVNRGQTVKIYMTTKNNNSDNNSGEAKVLTAHYYIDGDYEKTKEYNVDGKTVKELVSDSKLGNYDWDKYNVTASVNGTSKNSDSVIYRGESVKIFLATKSSNGSTTNKFPYKVYLHVYLNNNIGEPDRNINITNTLATDGVVSMSEVKNLIPDYYKAKNSNGINYDGLYLAKGNWVKDYVTDANKYEKLNDVDVRTGEEYVHINVMITNATAKTSSTADTSNPKTGDAIFMTITVMGLSAAALTGLFFYDKKRKAL